jgi:four helix bundle protein
LEPLLRVSSFRTLDAYRRSIALAAALAVDVRRWATVDLWTCGVQTIRAADSVGANIAEAYGRDTLADRRRQLYVARGSAFELEHWLELAAARGLACPAGARGEAQEISRMLNGLARRWSQDLRPDA